MTVKLENYPVQTACYHAEMTFQEVYTSQTNIFRICPNWEGPSRTVTVTDMLTV